MRDKAHSYGFAMFDVLPGSELAQTRINVTFFDTAPSATGDPTIFEQFTLTRPRRHTQHNREEERELAARG